MSLNNKTAYEYKSQDYFDEIHKIYTGAASKNNDGFCAKTKPEVFEYSEMLASSRLKKIIKNAKTVEEKYMPVEIDENCVVGWAERYYREIPNASKGDFIGDNTENGMVTGEIREPRHFKGLILPYNHKTNERFKKLMDCLNDRLSKKDLGAFYTPEEYAKKAAELVVMAVERTISAGKKDYVILDRCAGTGSLEAALIGLKDSRGGELISHCVVSTYEYYEYKVLNERIGDKVRDIVPSTEGDIVFGNGKILNADAMTKEYIENEVIKQYVDDEDYGSFSEKYFDCAIHEDDEECGVFCEADGTETSGRKCSGKSYYNENIIAYMRTTAMAINAQQRYLTRQKIFNAAGFYLRRDTYIEKLPMLAAKLLPQDSWDEKDVYFTTSDGGDTYTKDDDFLKACLLYTVLSNQNKCLSFLGSDGRMYQNELCLDNSKYERTREDAKKEGKEITSGSKEETEMLELLPVAYRDLMEYEELNDDEKELVSLWKKILEEARATEGYDSELNYGVYQITKELNTFKEEKQGKGKKKVYDYPLLNGDLNTLRTKLKEYYVSHIKDKMFKYQLIK